MNKSLQIVTSLDGSHTLYSSEINDHYHSIYGAVQESEYIFIKNGFDICTANPVHIFEVGFGTGLNALLTAAKNLEETREVLYTSVEKYPLGENIIRALNHHQYAGPEGEKLSGLIHSAETGKMSVISKNFKLMKIHSDFINDYITGSFDLIYFDAFGPDKQPEIWSSGVFEKISALTKSGGILVTYSAKGDVKRNLRAVGFDVKILSGPPGKRHIIRAYKI
ncbi:MAG: tRNA (5-methylaminomethyl-2-thiouridine)(34)-methyltransferase MnmD [Bacteroidales bacterium]|nr:tRNA (5-methylaminomethyl-2-thiouridine)(34)-methyltransferase MnmD [Bacteroidales bacterium]